MPNPLAGNAFTDDSPVLTIDPKGDAPPMSENIPGVGGTPVQPGRVRLPQPQVAPTPGIAPDTAHHSVIGRAFRALAGQDVSYSVNPQTGQTETTARPQAPGQLFRNIVAGAILGGATGARTHGGFTEGLAQGGAAAMGQAERQDAVKRQQAEQQFKNSMEAQKNQRENEAAKTEQDVRRAQIAHENAATLRENQILQGTSWEMHDRAAKSGQVEAGVYQAAGISAKAELGESGMNQYLKDHPEAVAWKWVPTGIRAVQVNGQNTYEQVYSAFDPDRKVSVTPALITKWKEAGLDKDYPGWQDIVKPGKQLTPQEFGALNSSALNSQNRNLEKNKQGLELQHIQAQIAQAKAATAKSYAEIKDSKDSKSRTQALDKAYDNWNGFISKEKLDPTSAFAKLAPGDQLKIGESMAPLLRDLNAAVSEAHKERQQAETSGDTEGAKAAQERANELEQQRSAVSRLATYAATRRSGAAAPQATAPQAALVTVRTADGKTGQIPNDQVQKFLGENTGSTVLGSVTPKNTGAGGFLSVGDISGRVKAVEQLDAGTARSVERDIAEAKKDAKMGGVSPSELQARIERIIRAGELSAQQHVNEKQQEGAAKLREQQAKTALQ